LAVREVANKNSLLPSVKRYLKLKKESCRMNRRIFQGFILKGEIIMEKPFVQLSGKDGNIFSIIGRVTGALKRAGQADKAEELWERVKVSESYNKALSIIIEYVEWD
jgi:hypothetical protein